MLIYDNLIRIRKKKLLTRNRFRNFIYSKLPCLYSIFTKWNVSLLIKTSQIYSYYLTIYT